ncbi:DNA/RNA non-specific endonuclease [Yersinia artesiana]|uniref:DNA/RNA non-specific endonuclease n=1 Tax=Yersinia artesiana TaxID=2890315 RepID=UPI001D10B5D8|nr:DNA/RNA non-specific endonuclease [Yersinia artesiana]
MIKAEKSGDAGDEGRHLLASIFDGPGEKLNFVPMDANLNKGTWKKKVMEENTSSIILTRQVQMTDLPPMMVPSVTLLR